MAKSKKKNAFNEEKRTCRYCYGESRYVRHYHTHRQAPVVCALAFINVSHSDLWVAAINSDAKVGEGKQRKLLEAW